MSDELVTLSREDYDSLKSVNLRYFILINNLFSNANLSRNKNQLVFETNEFNTLIKNFEAFRYEQTLNNLLEKESVNNVREV